MIEKERGTKVVATTRISPIDPVGISTRFRLENNMHGLEQAIPKRSFPSDLSSSSFAYFVDQQQSNIPPRFAAGCLI